MTGPTVRDLYIGTQNLTVAELLGIDLDTPVETIRQRLQWGQRVEEAEQADPNIVPPGLDGWTDGMNDRLQQLRDETGD